MDVASKNKSLIWIMAGIGLLLFYFLFDPMESRWMPQCVFHRLTGLQCMGCGAQRMLHCLLHGEIIEAMKANLFLFLLLPVIFFLVLVEIYRIKYPYLYRIVHRRSVIITLSAMLVGWLIVRNIYGL